MNEFKNCFVASFCVKIFLLSCLQSHISPLWPETGVQQKKVWVRPDPDPKKGQGTTRSESKKGLGKTESGLKKRPWYDWIPIQKKIKKKLNTTGSTALSTVLVHKLKCTLQCSYMSTYQHLRPRTFLKIK